MAEKTSGGQADTKPADAGDAKPDAAAAATAAAAGGDKKAEAGAPPVVGGAATADAKPASKAGDPTDPPKAPEKYALVIADAAKPWIHEDDLATFEAVARKNGLTNEQAQAALDQRGEAIAAQSAAFRTVTEADPDYGGDKLTETQRLANLVLDKVRPKGHPRSDAFRSLLGKTGYGNNIEIVSVLADIGKLMAEDEPPAHAGGTGGADKKDAASVLYDNTPAT